VGLESLTLQLWQLWQSGYLTELFIKVIIFPGLVHISLVVLLAVWFERKVNARIHLRVGPYHVGPVMGFFQPIADFVKLIGKELIVPEKAHKLLYKTAPISALALSTLSFAFIPFGVIGSEMSLPFIPFHLSPGEYWVVYYSNISLLIVILLFSVRPFIIIAAGWACRSKYCTVGALRTAFQLLAYEVPLLVAIVGVVMVAGSFDLVAIIESQSSIWHGVFQPLGLAVFFVAMMAEVSRRPFDLPHAEQELVYGWATEYPGVLYGCFMMAEYVDLYLGAVLMTALFLGGWLGPAFLPPIAWFLLKAGIIVCIVTLLRGVFPRVRIDQLLDAGWTYLIPLALIQVLIILGLAHVAPGLLGLA